MIRTQIQLPDDIYEKAKSISKRRQVSLAELTRRGLEYMISVYSEEPPKGTWKLPDPRSLGWHNVNDEELKAASRQTPEEGLG